VLVGDFNGDGNPDLASGNCLSNDVSVLLNTGNGTFSSPLTFPAGTCPAGGAVGRFNADANLDIAIVNQVSDDVSILLGKRRRHLFGSTSYGVGPLPCRGRGRRLQRRQQARPRRDESQLHLDLRARDGFDTPR